MPCSRLLVSAFVALAAVSFASEARADGPVTVESTLLVVVGRVSKPNVTIVLARPTAAREAGAAHESMRTEWLARTAPVR